MGRFAGKTILITGGTSGIGLETAKRIASEGGNVFVTGTDAGRLEAAMKAHPSIVGIASDARDPDAAVSLADTISAKSDGLDGLFLNAGKGGLSPLGSITLDSFRQTFELNVAGTLFAAQALAPLVKSGGAMLLMASGAKTKGTADIALYAGSKGAIRSIALVLARAMLPQRVRVNTISPGPIDTSFHNPPEATTEDLADVKAMFKAMVPMGRMGEVAEAAAVATFLLSDESSFVTGADYAVDGGEAQL